jgi:hypothetical protein
MEDLRQIIVLEVVFLAVVGGIIGFSIPSS